MNKVRHWGLHIACHAGQYVNTGVRSADGRTARTTYRAVFRIVGFETQQGGYPHNLQYLECVQLSTTHESIAAGGLSDRNSEAKFHIVTRTSAVC